MRILVVNSLRVVGGGEKWLVRQARTWQQAGHEPHLVGHPGAGLQGLARDAGLPHEAVPMPHDLSPTAVLGLARVLRRQRPDVVLCCNERAFRLTAPASRLAGNPPLVYRNGLSGTFKNRRHNRLLFGSVRRMVVNSEALRQEMAAFGWIPPDRLRIIRNGIETHLYDPDAAARERIRREVGTAPQTVVAAVLARITEDKGHPETLHAIAALLKDGANLELWVVGEGSLRPELEKLVASLGIADRVRFLGFRTDMPAVLQAVDIVVQASHREGLPNTLIEAMAASRPIVASDIGGIAEVVVPGETATLVPPHSPEEIAKALAPLVASEELRRRYGGSGRRRVEEHFRLMDETYHWCRLFAEVSRRSARGVGAEVAA